MPNTAHGPRPTAQGPQVPPMNNVLDHINTHRDEYIQQLEGFLAIPSISALPAHAADVRQCA